MLARQLRERPTRERLVFCGHSRGGLECLALLAGDIRSPARCDGVALSQTPHGPSFVMESVLQGRHRGPSYPPRRRAAEALQHARLALIGARGGGRELTSAVWPALVGAVDRIRWPFPCLQTASWSSRPTAWLDSFHGGSARSGPAGRTTASSSSTTWSGRACRTCCCRTWITRSRRSAVAASIHARYWLAVLSVLLRMSMSNPGSAARARLEPETAPGIRV